MPGNNDRLIRHGREVPFGCPNHPIDTATSRIVDERVEAVPPRVADVNYVSLFEYNRDVAISVRRAVVLQRQGRVVMADAVSITEGRRGECLCRGRRKGVAPPVDTRRS